LLLFLERPVAQRNIDEANDMPIGAGAMHPQVERLARAAAALPGAGVVADAQDELVAVLRRETQQHL
jgi:hypothetical protein